MTKEEFLKDLEKRLQVLSEQERKDILEEYAQHIDLKVANGQKEEEAIRDFGDMEELISDILDAYHVNPDYGKKDNQMPEKVQQAAKEAGSYVKSWFQKVGTASRNLWHGICQKSGKLWRMMSSAVHRIFHRSQRLTDEMAEHDGNYDGVGIQNADDDIRGKRTDKGESRISAWRKKMEERRKSRVAKDGSKMKDTLYKGSCQCWQWLKKVLFLCWKAVVILCLSPVAIMGMLAFMVLGFLLVGVGLDYPFVGTALLTLGTLLGCMTFVWFVWMLLFHGEVRKKAAITFFSGLLLFGIGCGVAFAEFASFQYMGEKTIVEEQIEIETLEAFIPEEQEEIWFQCYPYPYEGMVMAREEDEQMKPGEVQIEVTYNAKSMELELFQAADEIVVQGFYRGSSFGEFMKYKDEVLNCLKNRQVYDWKTSRIQSVVIRGNAETLEKIK